MEYIGGCTQHVPGKNQIQKIQDILRYFATIQGNCHGLLRGSCNRGIFWQDSGEPHFRSIQQSERWLNLRTPNCKERLVLEPDPLVLCHLDLALRNILWLQGGQVCLLDWASAGFYPRLFEACAMKIMEGSYGNHEAEVRNRMDSFSEDEVARQLLLAQSLYDGIRYSFVS